MFVFTAGLLDILLLIHLRLMSPFKKVGNGGKPVFKNTEVDITVLSPNS